MMISIRDNYISHAYDALQYHNQPIKYKHTGKRVASRVIDSIRD